ncbi:hypothetical protein DE146DRAFT_318880 [Phaeosphaeria sp. MPI-PUGE-AT-0046c]|nr:hypothetical protein DE146DRAFT_318880 [Phaeosphaeria sp. MPI-PUGE-AT-0046c]
MPSLPKMTVPYLSIVNISALVISFALIVLSIVTIVFTVQAIDHDFSSGSTWYFKPTTDVDHHKIQIKWDFLTENLIIAAASLALVAGSAAVTEQFVATRNSKIPKIFKDSISTFFPAVVFVFSAIAIIVTSVRRAEMAEWTCKIQLANWSPFTRFHCTRELGVCEILEAPFNFYMKGIPVMETCAQLKRSRAMLIPLLVISALLLVSGMARTFFAGRKAADVSAEERVETLQRAEE